MSFPEFTTCNAEVDHGSDAFIKRHVAKAVALHANQDTVVGRLRVHTLLCEFEDGACKTAERKLVPVPSTDLHRSLLIAGYFIGSYQESVQVMSFHVLSVYLLLWLRVAVVMSW